VLLVPFVAPAAPAATAANKAAINQITPATK
jgi:hypothetical protein